MLTSTNLWVHQAVVRGTDPENRLIDVQFSNMERTANQVIVLNDFGSFNFPKQGDLVLILQVGEREYCLGKIENNYKNKIDGKITDTVTKDTLFARVVKNGTIFIGNLAKGAWLEISSNGDFELTNNAAEGIKYELKKRFTQLRGGTSHIYGLGEKAFAKIGSVIRNVPGVGNKVIPQTTNPLAPAIEASLGLVQTVGTVALNFVRLQLGHVIGLTGTEEWSTWAMRLRAILEVCNSAGIPQASIKIDEAGNIEIKPQVSGVVALDSAIPYGVYLGGSVPPPSSTAVLGEALITLFNGHTHLLTGAADPATHVVTGSTNTPTVPATATILSTKVKLN